VRVLAGWRGVVKEEAARVRGAVTFGRWQDDGLVHSKACANNGERRGVLGLEGGYGGAVDFGAAVAAHEAVVEEDADFGSEERVVWAGGGGGGGQA
jgi:hypothetical protein